MSQDFRYFKKKKKLYLGPKWKVKNGFAKFSFSRKYFACSYGAQIESFKQKSVEKSRFTVPLSWKNHPLVQHWRQRITSTLKLAQKLQVFVLKTGSFPHVSRRALMSGLFPVSIRFQWRILSDLFFNLQRKLLDIRGGG